MPLPETLLDNKPAITARLPRANTSLTRTDRHFLSIDGLDWGWFPTLSLTLATGLLLIAVAFSNARGAASWAEPLFWLGLLVLLVPVTARLTIKAVSRQERIALVTSLGLAFYLVKVMHNPVAFTFPDELSHYRNVVEVLRSGHLFQANPVLLVTSFYPGLQTVTSALVLLSGADIFRLGLIVIGAARLILFLSLYLLYERVVGSARVASLATVIYMANTNFLFWTAQYAYESFALPLGVLVLFVVAYRHSLPTSIFHARLTVVALLGLLAVITTHHMTSYVILVLLWTFVIISITFSRGKQRGPVDLALIALVATGAWVWFIAHYTLDYLTPVLGGALESVFRLAAQEEGATRELFKSSSTGYVAPVWERWVGIGSVLLIALLQPLGLWRIWKRHSKNTLVLFLTLISLAYLPIQLMRFAPGSWETANRTSEFLFLGLSLVLAVALVEVLSSRIAKLGPLIVPVYIAILFMGGFIAGWPPKARMPRPYVVQAGSHVVEPQGVAAARWMLDALGPDNKVALDASNAKLIGAYGVQYPFTRRQYGIQAMLLSDNIGRTERSIIRKTGVRYIMIDRRSVSWDHMIGFYFNHTEESPPWELEVVEQDVYTKFDTQKEVSRIFDSGNIFIYDVGVFGETSETR